MQKAMCTIVISLFQSLPVCICDVNNITKSKINSTKYNKPFKAIKKTRKM